jgi:hypothetical protein
MWPGKKVRAARQNPVVSKRFGKIEVEKKLKKGKKHKSPQP